jgi:hypothetical protein
LEAEDEKMAIVGEEPRVIRRSDRMGKSVVRERKHKTRMRPEREREREIDMPG